MVELIELDPDLRYPLAYFVERLGPKVNNFRYEEETIWEKEQRDHRGHFLSPQERTYVDTLLRQGLFETKSRNYSMLLLVRFCYEQGMGLGETIFWVRNFFNEHHNDKSKDWLSNPEKCVRRIEYCVNNWWNKAYRSKRVPLETLPLSDSDYQYVESLNLTRKNKEFLVDTLTYILNNKQDDTIILSARQFKRLRNVHYGNEKDKLALLKQLRIIELKNEAIPKSRLAREYRVLYQFGSCNKNQGIEDALSEAFERTSDRIDALILSGHKNEEIRKAIPTACRQHIFYRRRRIEKMAERDQFRGE